MSDSKIFVLGAGTMGNGIAQVCLQKGMPVILCDLNEDILQKAQKNITWSVSKLIEKGKLAESLETILGRLETTVDLTAAKDSEMVIEAVFEKIEVKHEVLKKLDLVINDTAVVASNTSAIPISNIAAVMRRPENFVGLHFFNPVPMMEVVEVIRGILTSDQTFNYGADFIRALGKEPILVHRDIPGFILNRINMLSNMEAYRLAEQGIATPDDIDKGLKLAFGRRMGPFETSDLVGLDVQYMAYMNTYEEERDLRFLPPSILKKKVLAGHLGRKTGKGWYEYNPDGSRKK